MEPERLIIPGIVKNGAAVPQSDTSFPEGIRVEILVTPADLTAELRSEYEQWDKAGDEAWAMIDQWEAEVS